MSDDHGLVPIANHFLYNPKIVLGHGAFAVVYKGEFKNVSLFLNFIVANIMRLPCFLFIMEISINNSHLYVYIDLFSNKSNLFSFRIPIRKLQLNASRRKT